MNPAANTLREQQLGPFRVIEKSYAPDMSLGPHEHSAAYISFLLAGDYMEVSRQDERVCSSGTVIWHPKSESHADRFHTSGGHLLDLEIEEAWLTGAGNEFRSISQARVFRGGLPFRLGLRLYRELTVSTHKAEDVATELLVFFLDGPLDRRRPAWFNRTLQICNEIHDQRLSLSGLGLTVGVHPVHIARSFRRFMGCTFGEYLGEVRIRKAFELLRASKKPVVEVAYACGFADHAHLCRALKKSTGLTPSALRKIARSNPA